MSHKIDFSKGRAAFVSFAAPAWHNLGKTQMTAINAAGALTDSGQDFTVLKLPNVHNLPNGDEIISTSSFFTCRTDTNAILGDKIGSTYEVMQNAEALNVVDEILQAGTATIETAGAIEEGRKVFICLKINKSIIVAGNDVVDQYLLICNSHDGSLAITIMNTNVRVVCYNTLTAALRGAQDKIKIRHSASAAERLTAAAKAMKLIVNNTAVNEDNYNSMRETVISQAQMMSYFGNIFCTPDEIKEFQQGRQAKDVLSKQKQKTLSEVMTFARTGQGQQQTYKGYDPTMWTAYNAVTGIVTRKKFASASDRADNLLFGSGADTIHDAGVLALAPEKVKPMHKIDFTGMNLN